MSRAGSFLSVEPEERDLAGRTRGILYVLGGLTVALLTVLPGVTHVHLDLVYGCCAVAVLWGVMQATLLKWSRVPWWVMHVSNVAALGLIAAVVASTGGSRSPAWVYVFLVVVPAAYFYRPGVAIAYLAGCVLTHAAAIVYDPRALHEVFLAQFEIAAPSYLVLGGATLAGKQLMRRLQRRAEQLAAEQATFRRVATAVVSGCSADEFFALVAREAGGLVGAGAARDHAAAGRGQFDRDGLMVGQAGGPLPPRHARSCASWR